jgi:ribosomal protein L40E
MDNDERERRDQPAPDAAPDDEPAGGPEPSAAESPTDEPPSASASEIESWPSEDIDPGVTDAGESGATAADAGPVVDAAAVEAWPTEPPTAGSGGPDAWPTTPPEMGDEPILEPTPEPAPVPAPGEPPPSEVEAYAAPAAAAAAASSPDPEPPPAPVVEAGAAAEAAPEPDPQPDAAAAGAAIAAGGTAESTLCPRCGTENPPGLSFCRSCGQRLVAAGVATTVDRPGTAEGTMACPRCGTHNRAGVAFCQNCGANLRGTSAGYVPPAVAGAATATAAATARGGAVLGPVVLLIGIVGLVTAYLLPFLYGTGSLFDRAFGAGGYGAAFWSDYPDGGVADQAYFGLAAAVPILAVLLGGLAIAGFVRARPGPIQMIGLVIAMLWSVGLAVLFLVVEVFGSWDGDIVGLLRVLTPAGIILFLSSLIIIIGTLTRLGRS